jgi:hypothetical protein
MSTSGTLRAPVRTEPNKEEIAEAAGVYEAEIALERHKRNSQAGEDAAWDRAFEHALNLGNSAKSAAMFATVNFDAFTSEKDSPKVPAATAKRKRAHAIERLAEARLAGSQASSD